MEVVDCRAPEKQQLRNNPRTICVAEPKPSLHDKNVAVYNHDLKQSDLGDALGVNWGPTSPRSQPKTAPVCITFRRIVASSM